MDYKDNTERILMLPEPLEEDVKQQATLIRLETDLGKELTRKFNNNEITLFEFVGQVEAIPIDKRLIALKIRGNHLVYGEMPLNAEAIGQDVGNSIQASLQLLELLETKLIGEEYEDIIFEFLSDPTDRALDLAIKQLKAKGVIKEDFKPKKKKTSIRHLILRALRTGYLPGESINKMVEKVHTAKRPYAASRQALRSAVNRGEVEMLGLQGTEFYQITEFGIEELDNHDRA